MSNFVAHVVEDNLSIAWAKTFLQVIKHPEISPLTITIKGLSNNNISEHAVIRKELDDCLIKNSLNSCQTTANTIFPKSLWNRKKDRNTLYERYLDCLPQISKCKNNAHGIYFERLIAYGNQNTKINQLEYIIQTYRKGNHRRSALQATIFNPFFDTTNQRQRGFPCLQQVGFARIGKSELSVTGYYPKEHILDRGYGNYLGLCRLGQFMALEMGLELAQMTCFVGVAIVGKLNKKNLGVLKNSIEFYINEYEKLRGNNYYDPCFC